MTASAARESWLVYLLECEGGHFYCGITTDLERRFNEHCAGVGARYTRAHPPLRVLAIRAFANRSEASRGEAAVKKLPRSKKLAWFEEANATA
jgi:putative endonuclease